MKDIRVRYWINIGGVYSDHFASIYNKEMIIGSNDKIHILKDEFTGYFGNKGTREEN